MDHQIFDERGFLSEEGRKFVNDGFLKETKRVLATAQSNNDLLIISSILKSIIADCALATSLPAKVKTVPPITKSSDITPLSLVASISSDPSPDLLNMLSGLTDIPPMDQD